MKKSFTLIEVSIVLLVISILTALVLSGTSLINQARATNIIKEITKYQEAIYTFYKTYEALPGDYANAQYDFGPSEYTTKSWSEIESSSKYMDILPHNGDQNGSVSNKIIEQDGVYYSECFGVWSHLSASKLIEGNYSNICYNRTSSSIDGCAKGGYNLPLITNGQNSTSVYLFYKPDNTRNNDIWLIQQLSEKSQFEDHVLLLTDLSHHTLYLNYSSVENGYVFSGGGGINSALMFIVDNKIDDGKPLTGNVLGLNASNDDSKANANVRTGQCNTYEGNDFSEGRPEVDITVAGIHFHIDAVPNNLKREEKAYTNSSNKTCLGAILFKNL